jgi:hypothetical protein
VAEGQAIECKLSKLISHYIRTKLLVSKLFTFTVYLVKCSILELSLINFLQVVVSNHAVQM